MTKSDKIHKIYEKLNPEQLAVMGFEAAISCNEIEFNWIGNVLDKSEYYFTQQYRNTAISIQTAVNTWAVDYWRTEAGLLACQGLTRSLIDEHGATSKEFSSMFLQFKELSDKKECLKAALLSICDKTGVHIDKVLAFLCIDAEIFSKLDDTVDRGLIDECVKCYTDHI